MVNDDQEDDTENNSNEITNAMKINYANMFDDFFFQIKNQKEIT